MGGLGPLDGLGGSERRDGRDYRGLAVKSGDDGLENLDLRLSLGVSTCIFSTGPAGLQGRGGLPWPFCRFRANGILRDGIRGWAQCSTRGWRGTRRPN
jgi:hypothetical protein